MVAVRFAALAGIFLAFARGTELLEDDATVPAGDVETSEP